MGSNAKILTAFWCLILTLIAIIVGANASAAGQIDIAVGAAIAVGVLLLIAYAALRSIHRK